MNLVCCDIGNTNIKIGEFRDGTLESFRIFVSIRESKERLISTQPDALAISSVVPSALEILTNFISRDLGKNPFVITRQMKFKLEIEYNTPETLGIDRICTAEGAYDLFSRTTTLDVGDILVAADLGTACTINVIEFPSRFTGGIIAPGPGLLFKALKLYTAQLPEVSLSDYKSFIGKTTNECIASGVKHSIIGMLNYSYQKLYESGRIAGYYLTGGNAGNFLEDLDFPFEYIPHLLVNGIKSIYDLNK